MADKLDQTSEEGFNSVIEKAFLDAEKDVYEYEGKRYTAHAAAMVFPMLGEDDFGGLTSSLKLNGMRTPIALVGDQIVDGRNRFRAAEKAGVKMVFRQLDPDEDICRFVMDMNIHRRNLTSGRKVALASTLRRMAIRIEEMRRTARRERALKPTGAEAGASDPPADAAQAGAAGSSSAPAEKQPAGEAGAEPSSAGAPTGDVRQDAAESAGETPPDPLETPSPLVSREKAAELAGVSPSSLKRFDQMVDAAPDLQAPVVEGKMSVADAAVVSQEDPELRRKVVDDVREGRARTGAQAIEKRTGRAPKARKKATPKSSTPAEGMPPLPSVGGGADAGTASAAGSSPAASPEGGGEPSAAASRLALPALALSPSLLLAGVRKVLPVIDLDPCSSADAQKRVRAQRYFDREEDGCQKSWDGAVYVFPPPRFAPRFASKLVGEMFSGRVPRGLFFASSDLDDEHEGLLLRNAKLTAVVHQLERTEFEVENGKPVKAQCRMVLYVFGFDPKPLYDAFDPWGKVLLAAER